MVSIQFVARIIVSFRLCKLYSIIVHSIYIYITFFMFYVLANALRLIDNLL